VSLLELNEHLHDYTIIVFNNAEQAPACYITHYLAVGYYYYYYYYYYYRCASGCVLNCRICRLQVRISAGATSHQGISLPSLRGRQMSTSCGWEGKGQYGLLSVSVRNNLVNNNNNKNNNYYYYYYYDVIGEDKIQGRRQPEPSGKTLRGHTEEERPEGPRAGVGFLGRVQLARWSGGALGTSLRAAYSL